MKSLDPGIEWLSKKIGKRVSISLNFVSDEREAWFEFSICKLQVHGSCCATGCRQIFEAAGSSLILIYFLYSFHLVPLILDLLRDSPMIRERKREWRSGISSSTALVTHGPPVRGWILRSRSKICSLRRAPFLARAKDFFRESRAGIFLRPWKKLHLLVAGDQSER